MDLKFYYYISGSTRWLYYVMSCSSILLLYKFEDVIGIIDTLRIQVQRVGPFLFILVHTVSPSNTIKRSDLLKQSPRCTPL